MTCKWVVESYALLLAALLLTGGSLGDIFGRRLIFCVGVGLFALASVWCGFAPDVKQLIAARAAQGVGGALLVPGSLAIISASFEGERRGRAVGTWSGFTAITTAFGPVLGGWLIEHVSWRAVFFINVPIACAVLLLSFWRVPESRAGVASGINNTVSRTAGLLGIACFGILMLQVFSGAVDRRLSALALPPEARRALDERRAGLAGAEKPPGLSPEAQKSLEQTVAESFVSGFRVCTLAAAVMALLSALSAALMIRGKATDRSASRAAAPA